MVTVTQTRREVTVRSARLDYVELDKRVAVLPTYDTTIPATPSDTKAPSTKLMITQLATKADANSATNPHDVTYYRDQETAAVYAVWYANGKRLTQAIAILIALLCLVAIADEPITESIEVDTITRETAQAITFTGAVTATGTADTDLATRAFARSLSPTSIAWSTLTGTPSSLSGYGIADAVASNDSRLTDSRAPTAHALSHSSTGTDAITPASIGAQDAGDYATTSTVTGHTTLTGTAAHGLGTAATTNTATSVGTPGVDTAVPTEKAVRDAIAAIPAGVTGATGTSDGLILAATGTSGQLRVTGIGIDANGNLRLANAAPGASATNTVVIPIGTPPTTSPADAAQLYGADAAAGNFEPIFRAENGTTVQFGSVTKIKANSDSIGMTTPIEINIHKDGGNYSSQNLYKFSITSTGNSAAINYLETQGKIAGTYGREYREISVYGNIIDSTDSRVDGTIFYKTWFGPGLLSGGYGNPVAKRAFIFYGDGSITSMAADECGFYPSDAAAGNKCIYFKTENGAIIKLYQETGAAQADVSAPAAFTTTATSISTLTISDPPTQAEVQALRSACQTLADDNIALRGTVAAYQTLLSEIRRSLVAQGFMKGSE